MSDKGFKPAFPQVSLLPQATANKGRRVPYFLAEDCITNYILVMGEHSFGMEADPTPRTRELITRRLTVSEDFDDAEVSAFLTTARESFAQRYPDRPMQTRLIMGIYTDEVLNDPRIGLPEEEKLQRKDRMTIFIVPYVLPNDDELAEIVAAMPGRKLKAEAAYAGEVDTAVAPAPPPMYYAPGDFVYDFGGLQP